MRTSFYLSLALISTTVSLQAMQGPGDDRDREKLVVKVKYEDFAFLPDDNPAKILADQRAIMSKRSQAILENLKDPSLRHCEEILAAHEIYKQALNHVQNIAFTTKYKRQLNRSLALANFFLGEAAQDNKERTADTALKHYQDCIPNCRTYIGFLDGDEDGEATKDLITYMLAESLISSTLSLSRSARERFENASEAGRLFEELSLYQLAYFSYSNAYELLITLPHRNAQQEAIIKGRLKILFPYLDEDDKSRASLQKKLQRLDQGPKRTQLNELNKGRRNWRVHIEERAEAFKNSARTFLKFNESERVVGNFLHAAKEYIKAVPFAAHPVKKDELIREAVSCIISFEKEALSLLSTLEEAPSSASSPVQDVYKLYYTSKFQVNIGVNPIIDLKQFICAFVRIGDFSEAKARCDILCQLEEEQGGLSEETKFLRMKVNSLMGNLDELRAYIAEQNAEKDKKKTANKKKKERRKANKIAEIAAAQEERTKQAAEPTVEVMALQPAVTTKQVVPGDAVYSPFEVETNKKNLAGEYRNQPIGEKVKTKGISAPAPAAERVEVKAESPKPKKKALSPDTFELCKALLSGNKENKSFSRDKVLTLFSDLNCEVNEARGKGSHTIIRYVTDKRDGSVVACFPEFEQLRPEEEDEEGPNVTMTIPKEWDGPMPFYLAKALRTMLETMGYTLETIEKEGKKSQTPKSHANNNNKKPMGSKGNTK